jgi:hypothetical protein
VDLWVPDDASSSIEYPLSEIMRRVSLKIKLLDRDAPLIPSNGIGTLGVMASRFRKLVQWKSEGVTHIRVFYDNEYYRRNKKTPAIMDPLHSIFVLRYKAYK